MMNRREFLITIAAGAVSVINGEAGEGGGLTKRVYAGNQGNKGRAVELGLAYPCQRTSRS